MQLHPLGSGNLASELYNQAPYLFNGRGSFKVAIQQNWETGNSGNSVSCKSGNYLKATLELLSNFSKTGNQGTIDVSGVAVPINQEIIKTREAWLKGISEIAVLVNSGMKQKQNGLVTVSGNF